MLAYLLKRLGVAILVALTVSLITFSMIYLSGDPAVALAGESATEEDIESIRRFYGYDRPILVQYLGWLGRAVQGDFGQSHYLREPVANVIFERLPTTMWLGFLALTFALTLSVPLGVLAAIRPNSLVDRAALTLAVVGQAMPSFWFALTLMLWLGIYWRLLPITGTASWANFVMPAIALGYYVLRRVAKDPLALQREVERLSGLLAQMGMDVRKRSTIASLRQRTGNSGTSSRRGRRRSRVCARPVTGVTSSLARAMNRSPSCARSTRSSAGSSSAWRTVPSTGAWPRASRRWRRSQ